MTLSCPLPSGRDCIADAGDWKSFVGVLRCQWRLLWKERIDDKVRAEGIARKDFEGFGHYFTKTLRSIIFFIVPISAGVILLRAQIVRLILGSGHFGWEQTIDTANALGYFAIALVFSSLVPLLARSFYALSNTKIPMMATILTVIISIIAGYLLSPIMSNDLFITIFS